MMKKLKKENKREEKREYKERHAGQHARQGRRASKAYTQGTRSKSPLAHPHHPNHGRRRNPGSHLLHPSKETAPHAPIAHRKRHAKNKTWDIYDIYQTNDS